mmetsp:Transcript_45416/g.105367  ORF Transcript_45416/g.105367 Transcript_45416/m.105367 type:complete len:104 (-) Transcript_45416:77-388(-)
MTIDGEGRILFRDIMRLHRRKLPQSMRGLGDSYVRKEFKLHYKPSVQDPHRKMFVREWRSYISTLQGQETVVGQELSTEQEAKLNDDQKLKLRELEKNAKALY